MVEPGNARGEHYSTRAVSWGYRKLGKHYNNLFLGLVFQALTACNLSTGNIEHFCKYAKVTIIMEQNNNNKNRFSDVYKEILKQVFNVPNEKEGKKAHSK